MLVIVCLSSQWFGNLVTMQWWNDLWLNEGLATFMEYFSLEKIFQNLSSVSTVFVFCLPWVLREERLKSYSPCIYCAFVEMKLFLERNNKIGLCYLYLYLLRSDNENYAFIYWHISLKAESTWNYFTFCY